MSEPYRIVVKVLSVDGSCDFGRQVDDEILYDGETNQGRICLHALYSFLPRVFAMRLVAPSSPGWMLSTKMQRLMPAPMPTIPWP